MLLRALATGSVTMSTCCRSSCSSVPSAHNSASTSVPCLQGQKCSLSAYKHICIWHAAGAHHTHGHPRDPTLALLPVNYHPQYHKATHGCYKVCACLNSSWPKSVKRAANRPRSMKGTWRCTRRRDRTGCPAGGPCATRQACRRTPPRPRRTAACYAPARPQALTSAEALQSLRCLRCTPRQLPRWLPLQCRARRRRRVVHCSERQNWHLWLGAQLTLPMIGARCFACQPPFGRRWRLSQPRQGRPAAGAARSPAPTGCADRRAVLLPTWRPLTHGSAHQNLNSKHWHTQKCLRPSSAHLSTMT